MQTPSCFLELLAAFVAAARPACDEGGKQLWAASDPLALPLLITSTAELFCKNQCCLEGQFCAAPGLCCSPGEAPCVKKCCAAGKVCKQGACCENKSESVFNMGQYNTAVPLL